MDIQLFIGAFLTDVATFLWFHYIYNTNLEGYANFYIQMNKVVLKNTIMKGFNPSANYVV